MCTATADVTVKPLSLLLSTNPHREPYNELMLICLVYDNLCIRLSLALVEAVLKKLALGKKELLRTTQLQTALYTKVSGTMRSLAGRCYYFSLKGESISIAGASL